ncbi:MAG: G8 domain-containing protein [Flavobacteriia bacterium]|jgi:hypothetical protein
MFKKLFFLLLFITCINTAFSRVNTATTGNWCSTSTWSCGVVPIVTDTIVIPPNVTVTVDCQANGGNAVIYVYGSLIFQNGQGVVMSSTGKVVVGPNGSFTGGTNGSGMYIGTSPTCIIYEGPNGNNGTPIRKNGPCTCTLNSCCTTGAVMLSTVLKDFTVELNESGTEYVWELQTEENFGHFLISTSTDGIHYNAIQEVSSTSTPCPKSYSINVPEPSIPAYHRLIFINKDGDSIILKTKIVQATQQHNYSTFYFQDKIIIKSDKNVLEWSCSNLMGETVRNEICRNQSDRMIELHKESLKKGFYFVVLKTSFETEIIKIYIE